MSVRAWVLCSVWVLVSATVPACLVDPQSVDGIVVAVDASLSGNVTVNGMPTADVMVLDGHSTAAQPTDPNGQYRFEYAIAHFNSPDSICTSLGSEPYATIARQVGSSWCRSISVGTHLVRSFRFQRQPPSVQIQAPADGIQVAAGVQLDLRGQASHGVSLDGASPNAAPVIVWASDLDGTLGSAPAPTPVAAFLSLGTHVLTAAAVNVFGDTTVDSVSVQVIATVGNQPPAVSITRPIEGARFTVGTSVVMAGSGADPEDGPLPSGSLSWSSSLDGGLGTGGTRSARLSAGVHVLTLVGTDSQGTVGSDAISVTVEPASSGSGTIEGTVAYGNPLPGVSVVLSGPTSATTTTNAVGFYRLSDLPAGVYTITITPPTWAQIPRQKSITLGVGETKVVNFDTSG